FSFISTSRDSASSASAEYSGSRAGGSSRSESGGSSPAFGGSKSGTWRSFSTRSLFSTLAAGGSILGGGRAAARFCSLTTVSRRAARRSLPTATSFALARRSLTQEIPAQHQPPSRSMTVNQETPKASDSPAIQAASK